MSEDRLFVLIRVPKSGSTTLDKMVVGAFPENRFFPAPETHRTAHADVTPYERFRHWRRRWRFIHKHTGALTEQGMWRVFAERAKHNDTITGHIRYGEPQLPGFRLDYITLLRDPRDRALSSYNYDRQGYLKRPAWRRAYSGGQLKASGKSFLDYLHYLADQGRSSTLPAVEFVMGDAWQGGTAGEDPFAFLKERYFHWGVLDRLDVFADQLSQKIGRPVAPDWKNRTGRRERTELSAEEKRMLEQVFAADLELYEKAREAVG